MSKPAIKVCVLSDIHLGHRRNSTRGIVKNLMRAIGDNTKTAQFDIIFLAGDVFDSLLTLPNDDIYEIDCWIRHLLMICAKYNILLRVLEGTPSHDWKQSRRFIDINEMWNIGAPVRYIEDLEVEYIPEIDRHVLYIPDQHSDSTDKTLEIARETMRAKGLIQVDLAIMHGQFDYQVPPQAHVPKHDSAAYLEMVRELIFIGHDHHHTRYERIIAQGSFDRLAHNEEEAKGHVEATLLGDGTSQVTFVENTGAMKFITIDCQQLEPEQAFAKINQSLVDIPPMSQVRLLLEAGHPLTDQSSTLLRMFPEYTWTRPKIIKPDEIADQHADVPVQQFTAITITRENIGQLLIERLERRALENKTMEHACLILEEIVGHVSPKRNNGS